MKISNMYEAKTRLSELVTRVIAGEEWAIARNGTPVVMLVPITKKKKKVRFGSLKGKIHIHSDVTAPLTVDELSLWEGDIFPVPSKMTRKNRK